MQHPAVFLPKHKKAAQKQNRDRQKHTDGTQQRFGKRDSLPRFKIGDFDFLQCHAESSLFFARPAQREIYNNQYGQKIYSQHAHNRRDEAEEHHDKQQVDQKRERPLGKRRVLLRLMKLRGLVAVKLRVTVWADGILLADIRAAMDTEQTLVLLYILAVLYTIVPVL